MFLTPEIKKSCITICTHHTNRRTKADSCSFFCCFPQNNFRAITTHCHSFSILSKPLSYNAKSICYPIFIMSAFYFTESLTIHSNAEIYFAYFLQYFFQLCKLHDDVSVIMICWADHSSHLKAIQKIKKKKSMTKITEFFLDEFL